jgi:2-keto-4-pentenoate hydratase/2-oxohepta-3-ene-1,7-dioic acid hydratase in catechol pathway
MTRWVRFDDQGTVGFGTLDGEQVQVFEGDMFGAPRRTDRVVKLAEVRLLRPVEPGKVVALYNNYGAIVDKLKLTRPAEPLYLFKPRNTYLDPGDTLRKPLFTSRVVFEGELAVVIGSRCRGVSESRALSHVFGYTCANDLTAVDVLTSDPAFAHWARAKGFDGSCPFGPAIATGIDPAGLVVRTRLNGSLRQDYAVAEMLFTVPQLVSRLSHDMTLEPGDLILCGTSVGVGVLKPGGTVEVEIAGIGTLTNRYEA